MLIPVTAMIALQIAAAGTPIGVAAASQDGRICVAMPAPALTPGTTLTLIQPDGRQSVLVATIVGPASACERLERALIPGPYYLVQRPSATASDSGTLWVAFGQFGYAPRRLWSHSSAAHRRFRERAGSFVRFKRRRAPDRVGRHPVDESAVMTSVLLLGLRR
jgi:hypothetical protein